MTPADLADEMWAIEAPETPVDRRQEAPRATARPEPPSLDHLTAPTHTPERRSTGKLVLNDGAEPASVEEYRRLAARLYIAQAERGTRIVMITSALVGEGKTLTATNLALTLSESYKKRVLLIDADLRDPGVHDVFRLPNVVGLNDGLRSDEDRKVPLIRVSDNLSVLTAGRPDPDPMSVLVSERMRRILKDAAAAFDWVIIDTPPMGLLSDAHLLVNLVDTVVLVVRAGATPLKAIRSAAEAVGRDRILGVVLNRTQSPAHTDAHHYYGTRAQDAVPQSTA